MRNRFKYSDWKDMFGKKRDLEENMMMHPEDVNATEHEDCYDCIKDGLYAGYVDWKRVFSNYTVEEIVNSATDDDDIFDALLVLDIKKDVKCQIRGAVFDLRKGIMGIALLKGNYAAYKNFVVRNADFFIDEAETLDEMRCLAEWPETRKRLCRRFDEIVDRYGWRETIEVFPSLEYEILDAAFTELLNGNFNCTANNDETELIQYMADVEKYRGAFFSLLREGVDDLLEVVPIYELPEIIRILANDMNFNEVYLWKTVITRIDLEFDEVCFEGAAGELFLKWLAMFEYGYDMMLYKLPLIMGTRTAGLETFKYLGIPDKVISESILK